MPPITPNPTPLFFGGQGILEGQVIDAESGNGIVGATLYLKEAGTWSGNTGTGGYLPEREVYVTDEGGSFRIEGLRDRRYHLDVEAPGYMSFISWASDAMTERQTRPFHEEHPGSNVISGFWDEKWTRTTRGFDVLSSALPLVKNGSSPRLTLHLRRGQRFRGVVKDKDGRLLEGARIEILSQGIHGYHPVGRYWGTRAWHPNRPVTSGADGSFVLTVAPGTRVSLRFTASGRPEERRTVDLLTHEGPLEVSLGGGRTLEGRVLNGPDFEMRVGVFEPRAEGRVWQTTTGPGGTFALEGVVGDRWVVIASAMPIGGAAARIVTDLNAPLELELRERRPVQAKVVDASDNPVAEALVSQELVLKHPEFTAEISSHSATEGLVKTQEDGTLVVPLYFQTSVATSDAEGGFRMQTVLDQGGEVCIRAFSRQGTLATGFAKAWVPLKGTGKIVLADRLNDLQGKRPRLGPADPYLEQFKSGDLEVRRKLVVEIRHEVGIAPERVEFLPVFLAGLSDEDHEIRTQSILGLGELRHPETFDRLVEALNHDDWTVRHYATWAISRFGALPGLKDRSLECLQTILSKEKSAQIRVDAAWLLVELGGSVDPGIFYEALRSDDDHHSSASQALGKLGKKEAIELLIDALGRSTSDYFIQPVLNSLAGDSEQRTAAQWKEWLDQHRSSLPPQIPVDFEPVDVDGWKNAAHRCHRNGDMEGAVQRFSRALELQPDDAGLWSWRGFLRWELGRLEEALSDFNKALELEFKEPAIWLHRALVRAQLKDTAGARSDAERALSIAPPDWRYRETAQRLLAGLA